ncbi:hypothetical protein I5Q34_16640 [Streptomyces sp. AV19]|uniref:hypothetical protein n=1 Tax=Streptomyces sp. AV19 TaxID=2793068 RepID=UPI0018FE59BC|nr:hypothetical protein [Streptomyces sp. AV19]MBH1935876.1 hypothetical protein [Streptomyces sp. AV19]MDG4534341.1 hypothetical protein [Streptomyces sp. AV19]
MKQGIIKTFGAAALGAAVAVVAAGTASAAAPHAGPLERATGLAAGTSRSLPIEQVAPLLPGGPLIEAGNRALGSSAMKSTAMALDKAFFPAPAPKAPEAAPQSAPQAAPADNKGNGGLLGLVPAGGLPKGLSTPNLLGGNRG